MIAATKKTGASSVVNSINTYCWKLKYLNKKTQIRFSLFSNRSATSSLSGIFLNFHLFVPSQTRLIPYRCHQTRMDIGQYVLNPLSESCINSL